MAFMLIIVIYNAMIYSKILVNHVFFMVLRRVE